MNASTPPSPPSERIGLIGLGLMGSAMAKRLCGAGFAVVGWDVEPARRREFSTGGGARAAVDAGEVFRDCRRVILSLPDSQVVQAVVREAGSQLSAGHILLDTSTGDPAAAETSGAELGRRGVEYLDATVSGSSAQVADGTAVFMVGGARAAYERCADLFACLGERAFHTGVSGTGAKMKLATNLVLGLNRAALAEGLAFAAALGLDAAQTLEIMRGSMAWSRIMDTKGEKMISGDFTPQARLSQHLKDVRLMLAATHLELPLTEAHRELLLRAEALGCGELDNSAIRRAYDTKCE